MNNTEVEYVFCLSCGEKMKKDSRYCMRCGALNYDHPDNKEMQPIMDKTNQEKRKRFGKNIMVMQRRVLLAVNILLVILTAVLSYLLIPDFMIPITISTFVSLFYLYCLEIIFLKSKIPGWKVLIPIENMYQYCDLSLDNGLLAFLLFIPGINFIIMFLSLYKLGIKFQYNGILTMLLPEIFIPMMAFSKKFPRMDYNAENDDQILKEKKYKYRKAYYMAGIIVLMAIFTYVCWDLVVEGFNMTKQFFIDLWEENYAQYFN